MMEEGISSNCDCPIKILSLAVAPVIVRAPSTIMEAPFDILILPPLIIIFEVDKMIRLTASCKDLKLPPTLKMDVTDTIAIPRIIPPDHSFTAPKIRTFDFGLDSKNELNPVILNVPEIFMTKFGTEVSKAGDDRPSVSAGVYNSRLLSQASQPTPAMTTVLDADIESALHTITSDEHITLPPEAKTDSDVTGGRRCTPADTASPPLLAADCAYERYEMRSIVIAGAISHALSTTFELVPFFALKFRLQDMIPLGSSILTVVAAQPQAPTP